MPAQRRFKKWVKWTAIGFLILLGASGGLIHYLVAYRFNEIVSYLVDRQSEGKYTYNALETQVSVWHGSIEVKNAAIRCTDISKQSSQYELTLPKVYVKIHSLTDLLFASKLAVDSLYISTPDLKAHNIRKEKTKAPENASFHISKIVVTLQKVLAHLEIKSLHLQDGAFTLSGRRASHDFKSDKINLLIRNFSNHSSKETRLLSADEIDFSIRDQHWTFGNAKTDLIFKRLRFSGSNQYFQVDSCIINSRTDPVSTGVSLTADKIYFNSTQLAALYENDELILDTLRLTRPLLNLQQQKQSKIADATKLQIGDLVSNIFKRVTIHYIDVNDGRFAITKPNDVKPMYQSAQTNLTIFNLGINPGAKPGLLADSISLLLTQLKFLTRDKLYSLTLHDFTINRTDIILRNAVFTPTDLNPQKSLSFHATQLRLRDFSLEGLMNKRLIAGSAELHNPKFIISAKKTNHSREDSNSRGIDHLYQGLAAIKELIDVEYFTLINGNIDYQLLSQSPMKAELNNINARILMNRFLSSDSLINIKQSISEMSVGRGSLTSDKIKLLIKGFRFNGEVQENFAKEFNAKLSDGTVINGEGLSWHALDWDLLQKSKSLNLDRLSIGNISVSKGNKQHSPTRKKGLTVLNIRQINIRNVIVQNATARNGKIAFRGSNVKIDGLREFNSQLHWNAIRGMFEDLMFSNDNITATIGAVNLDTKNKTKVTALSLESKNQKGSISVNIPSIDLTLNLASTDPNDLEVQYVKTDNGRIEILQTSGRSEKNLYEEIRIPHNIFIQGLNLNNLALNHIVERPGDTAVSSGIISLTGKSIWMNKQSKDIATVENLTLQLAKFGFVRPGLNIHSPKFALAFSMIRFNKKQDNSIHIKGRLYAEWKNVDATFKTANMSKFNANSVSGNFLDTHFAYQLGSKIRVADLIKSALIQDANFSYENETMFASAERIFWNPSNRALSMRGFRFEPYKHFKIGDSILEKRVLNESFSVKGDLLNARGVRFEVVDDIPSISIGMVQMSGVAVKAEKDKRLQGLTAKEKPMLSALTKSLSFPLMLDSLELRNGKVIYQEISAKTEERGTIPLEDVFLVATNIGNQYSRGDSLKLVATGTLFGHHIRQLRYSEAYDDSLGGFKLFVSGSPMEFRKFNAVTQPLASFNFIDGRSDTLFAFWTGNKFGAFGRMDFYYRDLKVQILVEKKSKRKKLLNKIASLLANSIVLQHKNNKPAVIFYERDRSKSTFNYWVKTGVSGLLSSVGVKKSKKYIRQFQLLQRRLKVEN
jgi:hypothetical protein